MIYNRRLAYLGPVGTNTEQACIKYDSAATLVPYPSVPDVAKAVELLDADAGVVPIENSVGGAVSITLDLLIHGAGLYICNEIVLPITHSLLVRSGTRIDEIQIVYSHPQALEQCSCYLSEHLPEASLVASMSTSSAVEEMLDSDGISGAIATMRAGQLYGAEILDHGIEDYPNNMTRFVVLSKSDYLHTGDDKTSICFSFEADAPGILYSVLGEFNTRNINLTKIESRPTREALGTYIFLVDLEGHRDDVIIEEALQAVKNQVSLLKVFGSYPRYVLPTD